MTSAATIRRIGHEASKQKIIKERLSKWWHAERCHKCESEQIEFPEILIQAMQSALQQDSEAHPHTRPAPMQGGEPVAWVAKSLEELPAGTLFTRHMPDEGVMRDALRLDYIEKNSQPNERANGLHVWWPKTFGNQPKGPTLREAIDAAIAKGEV